jgi:hypothetical protein
MRANYLFRAVEVPSGTSVVEFRFRPTTVFAGGLVSLLAAAALAVVARATPRAGADGGA